MNIIIFLFAYIVTIIISWLLNRKRIIKENEYAGIMDIFMTITPLVNIIMSLIIYIICLDMNWNKFFGIK